jgi:hypothetical protein
VLVSGEKALQLGLQLIAKIKGFAEAAQVPYRIWFIFSLLVSGRGEGSSTRVAIDCKDQRIC